MLADIASALDAAVDWDEEAHAKAFADRLCLQHHGAGDGARAFIACCPALTISRASAVIRSLFSSEGSPSEKRVPSTCRISLARRPHGRTDDGADDALRPDALPDRSPGDDRIEPRAFERAAAL